MKIKNSSSTRLGLAAGILAAELALAACGGSSGSGSVSAAAPAAGGTTDTTSHGLLISGTPAGAVAVNAHYLFAPSVASTYRETLVYSIQNQPRWASFASTSGMLWGTPAASDAGNYSNIIISVHNGNSVSALQAFSISVTPVPVASGSSSPAVPAAAAAVGFNTMTYGPDVTLGSNWYPDNFYGAGPQPAGFATQNADGSLHFTGTGHPAGSGATTAQQTDTGDRWSGTAFGGGAYFESVLSFTGQGNGPYNNGGPAFWMVDVEHSSQGPYHVSWPNQPANSAGDPYDDFFEVDVMEYDSSTYRYQEGIGNWYGYPPTRSTGNPYDSGGGTGAVQVPAGTNFAEYHSYGCLWMQATPSTQGYLKFYFDGVQLGDTFVWNYDDPANPFSPPPVNNSTAMSGMDARHMFLILGTGTDQPMTVKSVTVWQASGADNLKE